MDLRIVPTTEELVPGFRRCVGVVARERKYIALLDEPPLERSMAFWRHVVGTGGVHLVALDAAGDVVGWVDVVRDGRPGYEHVGRLGMGILPEHRERGLGRRLMEAALDACRATSLERVELDVYDDNVRAARLYERMGFEREGVKRRARKLDGVYRDVVLMGRLLP